MQKAQKRVLVRDLQELNANNKAELLKASQEEETNAVLGWAATVMFYLQV
ncbi:hypothetical protein YC2023_019055 [Brassica napus]